MRGKKTVDLEICSLCNHSQPQYVRLQKKLNKFQSQQKQWLSSMKNVILVFSPQTMSRKLKLTFIYPKIM